MGSPLSQRWNWVTRQRPFASPMPVKGVLLLLGSDAGAEEEEDVSVCDLKKLAFRCREKYFDSTPIFWLINCGFGRIVLVYVGPICVVIHFKCRWSVFIHNFS